MAKGKNLAKLIGTLGLAGALSINSNGQNIEKGIYFDKIILSYELGENNLNRKLSIGGYLKNENCPSTQLIYTNLNGDHDYENIILTNKINNSELTKKNLIKHKDNTIDYYFQKVEPSLENCDIGETKTLSQIQNGRKENFSPNLQKEIKEILNLNNACNEDWIFFLQKEFKGLDKIKNYELHFSNLDTNRFPGEIRATALNSQGVLLSKIVYIDTDRDYIYDKIIASRKNPDSPNSSVEEIKINYEKGKIDYFKSVSSSPKIQIREGSQEDFSPEIQKRIKELVGLKIDCESNEVIPFLYKKCHRCTGG